MEVLNKFVRNKDAGIVLSAALLFVCFSLSSDSFLSAYNLFNISRIIAFSAFVALAQAVVLVGGGMNLSVGAIGGLATIATSSDACLSPAVVPDPLSRFSASPRSSP